MKNSNKQYMYSVLRQAWQELRAVGNKAGQALLRTPLPRILVLCIGLALLIALVPLILSLFVIFMLVKLFLIVVSTSARSRQQAASEFKPRQWSYKEAEDAQLVRVEQITYRRDDR